MTTTEQSYTHKMTGYEQVGEFHEVFGHPLNNENVLNVFVEKPELDKFRLALIEEEMNEFIDAIKNGDVIEAIDAIADTMYVVYGACHAFGINYDVVKTNPNKMYDSYENDDVFFNGENELDLEISNFKNVFNDLKSCCEEQDFNKVTNCLDNVIKHCYTLASLFGVDINKCFDEVNRSNMTKVCLTEDDAKESVKWYKENEHRYADPTYRKSTNPKYWVVFDNTTSKILKSIKFELPNLKKVINSQQ